MHIMLIDDDALVREMVLEGLSEEGFLVEGIASAEDALVLLSAGQVPDVIVADVNLGLGLSGADLAAIARERHPEVALLLISGEAQVGSFADASTSWDRHFLSKPFSAEALSRAIRAAAADRALASAR